VIAQTAIRITLQMGEVSFLSLTSCVWSNSFAALDTLEHCWRVVDDTTFISYFKCFSDFDFNKAFGS
jgi:hypothetical protein